MCFLVVCIVHTHIHCHRPHRMPFRINAKVIKTHRARKNVGARRCSCVAPPWDGLINISCHSGSGVCVFIIIFRVPSSGISRTHQGTSNSPLLRPHHIYCNPNGCVTNEHTFRIMNSLGSCCADRKKGYYTRGGSSRSVPFLSHSTSKIVRTCAPVFNWKKCQKWTHGSTC